VKEIGDRSSLRPSGALRPSDAVLFRPLDQSLHPVKSSPFVQKRRCSADEQMALEPDNPEEWGLVQNRGFSGNSTDGERALTGKVRRPARQATLSGTAEAGVAMQFQPLGVRPPCQ